MHLESILSFLSLYLKCVRGWESLCFSQCPWNEVALSKSERSLLSFCDVFCRSCQRVLFSVLQEENEVTEFFVTLEKDPQQEDFLQGRMPGNPYSSNEPGIGPLMRDIKNKICQDCDLVALLEDDSGMEVTSMGRCYHG